MESMASALSELRLHRLRLEVRLGWSEAERQVPQTVAFDVAVRFATPPKAHHSDELSESVCYAELSESLRELCTKQEFRLIEKLAGAAIAALRPKLPAQSRLQIRVTKERPPVEGLAGGASFLLGDWIDSP